MVIDIRKIIRSIIVFISFYLSSYLQYIPVIIFHLDVSKLTNKELVILSTFSSFIFSLFLIVVYRKDLSIEFKKFKEKFSYNIDTGFKYWSTGLVIMFISNIIITFALKAGGANNEEAVQAMIHSFPILMAIDAGIIGPFNEEMVFRKTIKDIFKNKWVFVGLSFLLFGGAHVINSANSILDYLYIIPYGALGASFALAYYDTDTVFTSTFMHMFHNTCLVLISIFLR